VRRKSIIFLLSSTLMSFLSIFSLSTYAVGAGGVGQRNLGAKGLIFRCPQQSVPIGLSVNAGTFVHGVRLICAVVSKGKLTTKLKESRIGGNFNGNHTRTRRCPSGHVLSGIKARGATYVDRINSIRCTEFGGTKARFVDVGAGGNGGKKTVRMYCSGSERIRELVVYAGSWMDQLRVNC